MADLDAILGIVEEPKPAETQDVANGVNGTLAAELQSAVAAEVQKLTAKEGRSGEVDNAISDQMKKILEKAKQLADEQAKEDGNTQAGKQQVLRQEFEQLLSIMFNADVAMDKDDIKKLRESGVFGPQTFWVTDIRNLEPGESRTGGLIIRGNLRTTRTVVFAALCDKVKQLFGDKYEVLMVEDPEPQDGPGPNPPPPPKAADKSSNGSTPQTFTPEPRVAFQVVPAEMVQPPQSNGWQVVVAGILLLLLFASTVQLSLVANITKLPKETLEYFANPDNLNNDVLPPGLDTWDPAPYLASALPLFISILGINLLHEVGHRIAAAIRKVKLGPTFFIPNLQIGSFGAITPFASLLRNRKELWDVAAAGPLAGCLASVALLLLGLSQSHVGLLPKELLVPVPTQLFQGSLLLGTVTRLALGGDTLTSNEVFISPLAIAGWCGLVTTSLNMLPVGCLDGGRMVQAAFGAQALSLTSFFTYVGLGLGFLGSSLSLPFGLYVLICQRSAEKYIQDAVTPLSGTQQTATAIAVLTAILILIPMAPELAESVGVRADPSMFL